MQLFFLPLFSPFLPSFPSNYFSFIMLLLSSCFSILSYFLFFTFLFVFNVCKIKKYKDTKNISILVVLCIHIFLISLFYFLLFSIFFSSSSIIPLHYFLTTVRRPLSSSFFSFCPCVKATVLLLRTCDTSSAMGYFDFPFKIGNTKSTQPRCFSKWRRKWCFRRT